MLSTEKKPFTLQKKQKQGIKVDDDDVVVGILEMIEVTLICC